MKESLERNILNLKNKIFDEILARFDGAGKRQPSYTDVHDEVEITPNISLTFQKWAGRKPYFIILWRNGLYIMEVDLSRVIFKENNMLTWILNIPTNKENRHNLNKLGYKIEKISSETVNQIFLQMQMMPLICVPM